MSRKIGIIGMGNVGAAVAHGAIAQGLADSYVFIDINEKKAEADAQDFKDAMANLSLLDFQQMEHILEHLFLQ